jgi:thioredoxin reductase
MPKPEVPRIAVLGAGPIGLEAALYARRLDLPVKVYERGRVGEHLLRWGHVRLFTPFGMNTTSLGRAAIKAANARHEFPAEDAGITGKEHIATYLEPLAKLDVLRGCLHLGCTVHSIGRFNLLKDDDPGDPQRARQPFRLLVREGNQRERFEEADVVLDCTGTYGQHRWLGDGGIPAIGEIAAETQLAYGLEDVLGERRNAYAGRNILLVGTGYSAATTICNLAALAERHNDTWVIWVARGSSTQPIKRIAGDPLRERDRLAVRANTLATRGDGNVEFHPQTVLDAVESGGPDRGFRISGRSVGKPFTREVDRVIANVGYTPNADLYRELQVQQCHATAGLRRLAAALAQQGGRDLLQQTNHGADSLRNPEPNFYILGAKSYGRNSSFLLRVGFGQVCEVFSLIAGKPNLNLYKKGV